MSKGISARGEVVDFDLLKIKQQIAAAPPSAEVKRRADFIENRLRRRTKKSVTAVTPVEVGTTSISTADPVEPQEDVIIEEAPVVKKQEDATKPKSTKQKARTSTKTE